MYDDSTQYGNSWRQLKPHALGRLNAVCAAGLGSLTFHAGIDRSIMLEHRLPQTTSSASGTMPRIRQYDAQSRLIQFAFLKDTGPSAYGQLA